MSDTKTARSKIWGSSTIRMGAAMCGLIFGGFLAWSAFAPLAEGVVVFGKVAVENNRKIVQHLEGGIIQDILVREGDLVAKQQPILVLADVSVASGRDQIARELADAQASVDRLVALSKSKSSLTFRKIDAVDAFPEMLDEIHDHHRRLFNQQRDSLKAELDVLRSRSKGLLERARNHEEQIISTRKARDLVVEDVKRSRGFLEQGMIRALELSRLEGEEARLSSDLARLVSEQSTARSQAAEIEQQIIQVRAKFNQQVSADLVEARAETFANGERLISAQDVVNRTTIYAPQSGEILNLAFSNSGAVVRPGETILEIVPDNQDLIATVELKPSDRDAVYEGLNVEARLSGLKSWQSPLLEGSISAISADLKVSPDGRYSYYEAKVTIGREKLEEVEVTLIPGMPIEAFVYSGETRTFLEYLMEPLLTTMRRGARE